MTVGVFAPKMLLPPGWQDWPEDVLTAVLLHERAHVSRRDTAIAILARINTCLFWFHPLAWALERTLAATAEFACDAAALRAIGSREGYAKVLVRMAQMANASGGRHQALGAAFGGPALLEKRVDRALTFTHSRPAPRWRKALVFSFCSAAILISCTRSVAPLRDNPRTLELAQEAEAHKAIVNMTPAQIAELESKVEKSPNDLDARRKLLTFYATSGDMVLGREKTVTARRPHILWLIANHPEHELAGSWGARIFPTDNDRDADPVGYGQAKALWLRAIQGPSVSAAVLGNAATFFQVADKALAEEILIRLQVLEPGGSWSGRLGRLYYDILLGSNASQPMGVIRSVNMAEAHGPHANAVREKLAKTKDAALLMATGWLLVHWGSQPPTKRLIDFDAEAVGRSYLKRAEELDPQRARSSVAVQRLNRNDAQGLTFRLPGPEAYSAVVSLPAGQKLAGLARLAEHSYMRGDMEDYYKHDAAAAKTLWDLSRMCAGEALQMAPGFRQETTYSKAVYTSNLISGMLAMRDGDRRRAVRHLLAAVEVPPSEDLAYSFDYTTFRLAGWLLKDGEREPVITFLERLASLHISQKAYLLQSAEEIRKGVKPLWYPKSS